MWPFKPKEEKQWKYIGHWRDNWTITAGPNKGENAGDAAILFYMTDDGDRKLEYRTTGHVSMNDLRQVAPYMSAQIWLAGGIFPGEKNSNYKWETDTLGEMLNRLVNQKITEGE